jgi:DNA topoisomerase IB
MLPTSARGFLQFARACTTVSSAEHVLLSSMRVGRGNAVRMCVNCYIHTKVCGSVQMADKNSPGEALTAGTYNQAYCT